MNWDDARIFLAMARSGQILGAARALGFNHATVARRLTALEDALGSTLFRRETNGTELTPPGRTVPHFCRNHGERQPRRHRGGGGR